jgi:hypothetical protein
MNLIELLGNNSKDGSWLYTRGSFILSPGINLECTTFSY